MAQSNPRPESFSIQIYNPEKAQRLAERFDPIANLTAGTRTALFESMVNMLYEKVERGLDEWQAVEQVTDEFAQRFVSTVRARHPRASRSKQNTTTRERNQSERLS